MSLMSDTPRRQLSLIDLSNRPAKGTTKNKPAPTSNNTTLHTPVRPPRTRLFTPLTTQQTLAEQLSFLHLPRPFKTAVYAKNSIRRTKNLQTVLGQEREREHRRIAGEERERDVAMDHDGRGGRGRSRRVRSRPFRVGDVSPSSQVPRSKHPYSSCLFATTANHGTRNVCRSRRVFLVRYHQ